MSAHANTDAAIDKAREMLSRIVARIVKEGSSMMRLRVVQRSGEPVEAWFYAHHDDGWRKEPDVVADPELARALHETAEMLASHEHGDDWSLRQHAAADHRDTELKFHREKLEGRLGAKLESAISGLLFRDSHDSKKDSRRAIRNRR